MFYQLLEAETMRHIFMNNFQLCNEISDRVVHHFVHCIETHGRHVQYLKFLETIVKADGKYVKKSQDKVMTEVRMRFSHRFHFNQSLYRLYLRHPEERFNSVFGHMNINVH